MKLFIQSFVVLLASSLVGCAIHDGHEDEPAPMWWPAFLYKPTTHPTTEEYDQAHGDLPTSPESLAVAQNRRDVRSTWNLNYADQPVPAVASVEPPAIQLNPAAATLYPNRGQAALASGSPTLYPANYVFNGGPARTASVFARGPLAPTGYLGR